MNRLEDDLRTSLRRHASDVTLVGGVPKEVRRRAHVRRAGTAVLSGVLAITLVVLGVGVVRSVLPDPAPPEPAPAPHLALVERVPVTPRSNGDLTYAVNGSILRRAPDGTTTTWVTRRVLSDACGQRGCVLRDLEWSPDGSQLAVVLGTIHRTSSSQLGVYVIGDDPTAPRRLFECPEAMCQSMQDLAVSWSPGSSSLAVAGAQFGQGLVIVSVNDPAAEPRVLCGDCQAAAPAWSPDGRWLAYVSGGDVRRISTDGGPSELIATPSAYALAWSPDGTQLVVDSEDAVRVFDLSRRPYTTDMIVGLQKGEGPAVPAWAPDGKRLSWFSTPQPNGGFVAEVWTAHGDGSSPQRLMQSGCCVNDWAAPTWSPDGRFIVLGLALDSRHPPDLIIIESAHGTERFRATGVGWGPMSWQGQT